MSRSADDGGGLKSILVVATLILAMIAAFSATADGPVRHMAEAPVRFDIPAQPLADALGAYGAKARIQLFVAAELTTGRRSTGIAGVFTPEAALRGLLAGTGLVPRAVGREGFTLVLAQAASPPVAAAPAAFRFAGYSATLQGTLRAILCRHEETRPGGYRVLVQLWLGPSGGVERAELVTSSKEPRRDLALAAMLRGGRFAPPPPGLPQPVTLLLTPAAAGGAGHCPSAQVEGGAQ